MNLTYRCKRQKLANGLYVKQPVIPVTLKGMARSLRLTAILDSGSDFVLLPRDVADALHLEYDEKKKDDARDYGGNAFTTTQSIVRITIERGREKAEVSCRCAILLDREKQHEYIIFGSSFFEHFKIVFDYPKNKFQIKR